MLQFFVRLTSALSVSSSFLLFCSVSEKMQQKTNNLIKIYLQYCKQTDEGAGRKVGGAFRSFALVDITMDAGLFFPR